MYFEGEAGDDSKLWSFFKLRYNSPKIDSKGSDRTIMTNYQQLRWEKYSEAQGGSGDQELDFVCLRHLLHSQVDMLNRPLYR